MPQLGHEQLVRKRPRRITFEVELGHTLKSDNPLASYGPAVLSKDKSLSADDREARKNLPNVAMDACAVWI